MLKITWTLQLTIPASSLITTLINSFQFSQTNNPNVIHNKHKSMHFTHSGILTTKKQTLRQPMAQDEQLSVFEDGFI